MTTALKAAEPTRYPDTSGQNPSGAEGCLRNSGAFLETQEVQRNEFAGLTSGVRRDVSWSLGVKTDWSGRELPLASD